LESLAHQSYRRFELVVQDGGSTDKTLSFLRGVKGIPAVRIASEPDRGIGQASNRALRRCRGEIIGSIDADNQLEPDALMAVLEIFARHPTCAAVYGASKLIDAEGRFQGVFDSGAFDLSRLMRCELVPPFASSFFSRRVCGRELRFDEELESCADYDLWLRIGHLPVVHTTIPLSSTRVSDRSMTRSPHLYEKFCHDKITALERYLGRYDHNPVIEEAHRDAMAGICLWAAESLFDLEGRTHRFNQLFQRAAQLRPGGERLRKLEAYMENLRELRPKLEALEQELRATQAELQAAQAELQAARAEFQVKLQAADLAKEELRGVVEKLDSDLAWSLQTLSGYERHLALEKEETRRLEEILRAIESSAGWRALNRWRRLRDGLAPEGTARRRWYQSIVGGSRGGR
jgi:glycosyltransferase involved in cell wall biosynthesis